MTHPVVIYKNQSSLTKKNAGEGQVISCRGLKWVSNREPGGHKATGLSPASEQQHCKSENIKCAQVGTIKTEPQGAKSVIQH